MSLSTRPSTALGTRPVRWAALVPLTAGLVLAGMPAYAISPAEDAIITGTVSFHETNPDRTVEVFRESGDTWAEDESLETVAASDGTYEVHVPAGEPVKIRVSYGSKEYGYWYGDGFGEVTAVPVEAGPGQTLDGVDLEVPTPAYVSGRVTDRGRHGMPALVIPSINNDGGLRPITDAPLTTSASGAYTVILPARYETGIMAVSQEGDAWNWLGGGSPAEPNFYMYLSPGEEVAAEDLVLPVGQPPKAATPTPTPAAATRLTATGPPVVRGAARKGAVLRATTGRWNLAPTNVRFQWLRNGKVIRGATKSAYRLHRADVRKRLTVRVTASRVGVRTPATVLSAPTHRVKRR